MSLSMVRQPGMIKFEEEDVKPDIVIKKEEESIEFDEDVQPEIATKNEELMVVSSLSSMESRKRNRNKRTEKNNSKRVPKHMKTLKKCCVCGEMNQKYQMTMAPKLKKVVFKWSQVFGSEFLETCSKPNIHHYICSIHWKQLRDDWEGPLPEILEKMKKENNGSFETVMFLNDIDEEGNGDFLQKFSCRYCGAKCIAKDMTTVPKNEEKLSKWAENLGEEFLEIVQKHNRNMICWSHFKYRNSHNRNADNLPMTDEMMNVEKNDNTIMNDFDEVGNNQYRKQNHTCRYCGISCLGEHMTVVPRKEEQLMDWTKILGEDFLENVRTHKTNRICRSHFENHVFVRRGVYDLPMTNEMMEEEMRNAQFEKCRYCDSVLEIEDMVLVPENRFQLDLWINILGSVFFQNVARHSKNYICWAHFNLPYRLKWCYMNYLPDPTLTESQVEVLNSKVKKTRTQGNKYVCQYCGMECHGKNMTAVPTNETQLLKWAANLGEEFLENVRKHNNSMICWSHFKYRISRNRNADNLPLTDEMMNVEKNVNKIMNDFDEVGNNENSEVGEVQPKIEVEKGPKYICRYCGARCSQEDMTSVPKNETQLVEWTKRLGQQFFKNVRSFKTNKICLRHFNLERGKHRNHFDLPITDEMMDEEMANNELRIKSYLKYREINSTDVINLLPMNVESLYKDENKVNISNYEELQDMKSEEKPDMKIPEFIVKKEEEEEKEELDEMEMNGMFSVPDNAHSTNFLIENETKPLIIIKKE